LKKYIKVCPAILYKLLLGYANIQNTALYIKDMQIPTWGSYIRRNLPPDLGTEISLAK